MKNKLVFSLLYLALFIQSFSAVLLKLSSLHDFMSTGYIACLAGAISIMILYALIWQQVLKNLELSVAMANKPVVLGLSFVWARFFFNETLTLKILVGGVFIVTGILLVTKSNNT